MTSPVSVLVNALHAKAGGGLTYLAAILPRLAERSDLRVHLLVHKSQRSLFEPANSRIVYHVADFMDGFIRRLIWEQVILPLHAWACADVTFSPANFGPLLAPRPVLLLRNALDVEAQEDRLSKRLYWKALSIMTWLSLLRAPLAGAVSDFARKRLSFAFGRRVRVIWHGVDKNVFFPAESGRKDFILAVGDITVQKNFTTLISAVARVEGVSLQIAGQRVDDAYAQALEKLIVDLGLSDRVRLLGRVEPKSLAELYRTCRLFAFPSTVETFGNPLLEAMACGCAILCTDAAAMPEVLGDAGRYLPPQDDKAWADEIALLWSDEELRAQLGCAAQARSSLFDWDVTAKKTAELLLEAANKGHSQWSLPLAWVWVGAIAAFYLFQFRDLLPAISKLLK